VKFFYCASGPEGDPVLVIRQSLPEEDIRTLKQNARLKTFAHGDVIPSNNGLLFKLSGHIGEMLEIDLKRFFSKKVSALQNARVVSQHPSCQMPSDRKADKSDTLRAE